MTVQLRIQTDTDEYGMTRATVYCRDALLCQHAAAREDVAVAVALLQVGIDLREERYSLGDMADEGGVK